MATRPNHRKISSSHVPSKHRRPLAPVGWAPADDGPVVLRLVEFEVVHEPMDDPYCRGLPQPILDRIDEAAEIMSQRPRDCVKILEQLIEQQPDIPRLYNYLCMAYQDAGKHEEAYLLSEETHRKFPNYLFGITTHAVFCMARGQVERVPAMLNHRLSLTDMYPNRRRFHVSEFVAFESVLAEYFWRIGDRQNARSRYRLLNQISPDHARTRYLRSLLQPLSLRGLMAQRTHLRRG